MSREPEDEAPPKIKVTDRRLFDADGNFRTDVPGPEAPDEGAARHEVPPAEAAPAKASPTAAPAAPAASPAEEPPAPTLPGPDPERAVSDTREPAFPSTPAAEPAASAGPGQLQPGGPAEAPSSAQLPRDLSGFVESQYYETLLYLGAIQHPQTGQVIEDLDLAQYKIDLLSMLQEKTEGNRTPEESQLLEDVLYQLRMAFLQKRKVAKL